MTWLVIRLLSLVLPLLWFLAPPVAAQQGAPLDTEPGPRTEGSGTPYSGTSQAQAKPSAWHYGGFADLAYMLDFNFPENRLWRGRTTTPRVNELDLNWAGLYMRRDATEDSRWGVELLGQTGEGSKRFGFAVNSPKVGNSDLLRHFGRANASYLAPIGNGLTIQGGLFDTFLGYDSLYAQNNVHYTRAWGGDYTPYMMFGANASYPFTDQLTGAVFVINEYSHLAHANDLPSYGGQLAYKATPGLTVKETLYYGPDQAATAIKFWRLFSDTIVEWKQDPYLVAFEYQIGTENVAVAGSPRAFWTHAMLSTRWNVSGPWSVAVRPEFYWDRNGRMTGSEQFIKAMTSTLEYRFPYQWTQTILRLEYRWDESTGADGGFFKDGDVRPGVPRLTAAQHMLIFAAIWTFDSP